MRSDTWSDNNIVQIYKPQVTNSDQTTGITSIDLSGFDSCLILFSIGLSADTLNSTNKIELEIQESDDNTTFTAVADASITNAVTGTNTGTVKVINSASLDEINYQTAYIGTKRYVRPSLNFSGTHSTGTPIGITAIKGHGYKPQNATT
jgi:hypothetical protein